MYVNNKHHKSSEIEWQKVYSIVKKKREEKYIFNIKLQCKILEIFTINVKLL